MNRFFERPVTTRWPLLVQHKGLAIFARHGALDDWKMGHVHFCHHAAFPFLFVATISRATGRGGISRARFWIKQGWPGPLLQTVRAATFCLAASQF